MGGASIMIGGILIGCTVGAIVHCMFASRHNLGGLLMDIVICGLVGACIDYFFV
jgi:uncharacterized membrane protein YeaQ/YmgE (transglycosylase-associated protein family)